MFKISLQYLLFILCFCISFTSHSAVVDGLFKSSVEVNSQQPSERGEAFNQALVKTLIKLSGHRNLVKQSSIQSQFFPAERFVQSFSYKENPEYLAYMETLEFLAAQEELSRQNPEAEIEQPIQLNSDLNEEINDTSLEIPEIEPLPFILEVEFASSAIESQMKKNNIPIWGKVRPKIMLWALVESDGVRQLTGLSEDSLIKDAFLDSASQFALPISFPQADDLDLSVLNLSDLWGLFPDALDQAAQRYSENGNIMIRLHKSIDNIWSSNWLLVVNNVSNSGTVSSDSIEELTSEIINSVSELLSERLSIVYTDDLDHQSINLEISGINNFSDYIDVQEFLEALAPVKVFSLESFEAGTVSVSIALNSSYEQFKEYLSLSGKLEYLSSSSFQTLLQPIHASKPNELAVNEPNFNEARLNQKTVIFPDSSQEESLQSISIPPGINEPSMVLKSVDKYKWIDQTLGKRE